MMTRTHGDPHTGPTYVKVPTTPGVHFWDAQFAGAMPICCCCGAAVKRVVITGGEWVRNPADVVIGGRVLVPAGTRWIIQGAQYWGLDCYAKQIGQKPASDLKRRITRSQKAREGWEFSLSPENNTSISNMVARFEGGQIKVGDRLASALRSRIEATEEIARNLRESIEAGKTDMHYADAADVLALAEARIEQGRACLALVEAAIANA